MSQDRDRSEVAAELLKAESLRDCFSATSESVCLYEVEDAPSGTFKTIMSRLSAGDGRFRQVDQLHNDEAHEVRCWDGVELRSIQEEEGQDAVVRSAVITNVSYQGDHLDELETTFGLRLRYPATEKSPPMSPGEALADPSVEAEWEYVDSSEGQRLRLILVSPWNGGGPRFEYLYDVEKQYLPLRIVKRVFATAEDRDADTNPSMIVEDEIVRSELIDEVWMPLEMNQTVHFPKKDEVFKTRVTFSDITLNPEFDDATFTIDIASLPLGTPVGDARLGISYKLGENLVYMDGRLHETPQPITAEITPAMLGSLMEDAVPLIDPRLKDAEIVEVEEPGISQSAIRVGALAAALLLFGIAFYIWRGRG